MPKNLKFEIKQAALLCVIWPLTAIGITFLVAVAFAYWLASSIFSNTCAKQHV